MSLPNYDRWLVAPYERADREAARFEAFCEDEGIDFDDPTAGDRFQAWCDEQDEAWAEAQAEARAEALIDRMEDWMGGDDW